jgi:hypothetical protein
MLEHTDRELFEEDSLTETNNNNVNIKYTNKKKIKYQIQNLVRSP